MADSVAFTPDSARRIAQVVRQVERLPYQLDTTAGYPGGGYASGRSEVFVARVTSTTADSNGNYPAVITRFDVDADAWVDYAECKLKRLGSDSVTDETRYPVTPIGELDGERVYLILEQATDPTSTGVISVFNYDSSSYVGISILRFANTLYASNTGAGEVTLQGLAADTIYPGVVSVSEQSFAGKKIFRNQVQVGHFTETDPNKLQLAIVGGDVGEDTRGTLAITREDAGVGWAGASLYSFVSGGTDLGLQLDSLNNRFIFTQTAGITYATKLSIQNSAGTIVDGVSGTLLDGSVIVGGLVTSIGDVASGTPPIQSFMGF